MVKSHIIYATYILFTKERKNVRRVLIFLIIFFLFINSGCTITENSKKININATSNIEKELSSVQIPNMNIDILNGNENELFNWLISIYKFQDETLRVASSSINEQEISLIQWHLEQVFSEEIATATIKGLFQYDSENNIYWPIDTSWFSINEDWTSVQVKVVNRSNNYVTVNLKGIDSYGGDERNINYVFEILEGRLIMSKIEYLQ